MVMAGIITIVAAFLARPIGFGIAMGSLIIAAIVPVVYSYLLWSKERGERGHT
jgi:hypothetical protein